MASPSNSNLNVPQSGATPSKEAPTDGANVPLKSASPIIDRDGTSPRAYVWEGQEQRKHGRRECLPERYAWMVSLTSTFDTRLIKYRNTISVEANRQATLTPTCRIHQLV